MALRRSWATKWTATPSSSNISRWTWGRCRSACSRWKGRIPKLGPKHVGVATLCRSLVATLGPCHALPKNGVPLRWLTARLRLKAAQVGLHLLRLVQVLVQLGQVLGTPLSTPSWFKGSKESFLRKFARSTGRG